MLVLVPAYEPDLRLVELVRQLVDAAPHATVLVVDDGSGDAYAPVFEVTRQVGAVVLRFAVNRGKGAALKAGFGWAMEHRPGEPVVCADCDGQHRVSDILWVAAAVSPATMVLGGRRFTGGVPARSRAGNGVSRLAFRALTGIAVHDTQTGLRAYPADLLPWLCDVPGDRFEYEFNMLLAARRAGVRIHEVEIETVYLDANASSHFRPVLDSLRVFAPVLRFAASSLAAASIDFAAVLALHAATGNLLAAVVAARVTSAAVNFRLNQDLVFGRRPRQAALRYAALAIGLLAVNYLALVGLVGLGWAILPAKAVVEAVLFTASYKVQQRLVFQTSQRTTPASVPVTVSARMISSPPAAVASGADAA